MAIDLSPLWHAPAHNLVPSTLTPIETYTVHLASEWAPSEAAKQLAPKAVAQALSPEEWATPKAIIPDAVRTLATAAILAVMV